MNLLNNNIIKNYLEKILIFSLIFFIFTSIVHKFIDYYYEDNFTKYFTLYTKLLFEITFILILLTYSNKNRKLLIYVGCLSIVFILGTLSESLSHNSVNQFYSGNIATYGKFLYPFILLGIIRLLDNNEHIINIIFEILEKLLVINSFIILIGFLFSIDYFQSYEHSNRFGYSGLFQRVVFTHLSIIMISRNLFNNKINWSFLLLTMGCLLTGTKVSILFFIVIFLFYLYEKKKFKILKVSSILLIVSLVFIESIIERIINIFPFWKPILNKYGIISSLVSTRDINIQRTWDFLKEEGSIYNVLFGGIDYSIYYVEIDIIDLFLFFGLVGGVIYLFMLSKIINKRYHLIPLLSASLGGWFFLGSISMSIYFLWMYESHNGKSKLF